LICQNATIYLFFFNINNRDKTCHCRFGNLKRIYQQETLKNNKNVVFETKSDN